MDEQLLVLMIASGVTFLECSDTYRRIPGSQGILHSSEEDDVMASEHSGEDDLDEVRSFR